MRDWKGKADLKEFFNPHVLGMKLAKKEQHSQELWEHPSEKFHAI